MVETLAKLDRAFDELRFDEMADAIYHFIWGTFCDWYVELVKGAFDDETKRVAAWAFDQILVMLHPLMPFVTEELWHAMGERPYELIVAKWPEPQAQVDPHAKRELDWLIRLVSEVRSARTELNVPPSAKLNLFAGDASDETAARLDRNHETLSRLARLESVQLSHLPGERRRAGRSRRSDFCAAARRRDRHRFGKGAPVERGRPPPRRSVTVSLSGWPTRISPSAPSRRRSRRRGRIMRRRRRKPNGCVLRWSGWGRPHPSSRP